MNRYQSDSDAKNEECQAIQDGFQPKPTSAEKVVYTPEPELQDTCDNGSSLEKQKACMEIQFRKV
jgi:hypothetical protein